MLEIPDFFWTVEYNGENFPRESGAYQLTGGANCQVFAYALLQHFGIVVPPLRSSDLWSDTTVTRRVSDYRPLDLLLFNRTEAAWGAHVAVFVGENKAIHLSAATITPVIWRLEDFAMREQYAFLLGGKRVLASAS